MKKLVFILLLVTLYTGVYAQGDNKPADTTKFVYCQIVGHAKVLSNKLNIEIDFGQFRSIWTDNKLKDPVTGEKIVFNGMIDALNYMGNLGWEFVQAYAFSQGTSGGNAPNVYYYLLKKSKRIIQEEDKGALK